MNYDVIENSYKSWLGNTNQFLAHRSIISINQLYQNIFKEYINDRKDD